MTRKFLSLILSMALLLSLLAVPSFGADFSPEKNKYMLMDFSQGMPEGITIDKGGAVPKTDAVCISDAEKYGDSKTALAIDYSKELDGEQIILDLSETEIGKNLNQFKGTTYHLVLRAKIIEDVGALTVYFCRDGHDYSEDASFVKKDYKSTDENMPMTASDTWQDYSCDFRISGANLGGTDGDFVFDSVVLKPTGTNGCIYIDSLFICYGNSVEIPDGKIMAEFQEKYAGVDFTQASAQSDAASTRIFDHAMSVQPGKNGTFNLNQESTTSGINYGVYSDAANNVFKYNYLNMWILLRANELSTSKENTAGFSLYNKDKDTSISYEITSDGYQYVWRLISIPVDDLLVKESTDNIFKSGTSETSIRSFTIKTPSTNKGAVCVDYIWFSKEKPATTLFEIVSEEKTDCRIDDAIEIEFSHPISPVFTKLDGAVTVTAKNGSSVPEYKTEINGNKLIIKFADFLNYNTSYDVALGHTIYDYDGMSLLTQIDGVVREMSRDTDLDNDKNLKTFTFTTEEKEDINIYGINLTNGYTKIENLPSAGLINVNASLVNKGALENPSAALILAIYSGNELESIRINKAEYDENGVAKLSIP